MRLKAAVAMACGAVLALAPATTRGHGGGLDDKGCHREAATGSYHCHRAQRPASRVGRGRAERSREDLPRPGVRDEDGADYEWPVKGVIDGDTVAVDASADMPPELAAISIRLRGVDTPERGGRAQCAEERRAGEDATAFTTARLADAERVVTRDPEWGKWGGRVVADLIVDGQSLARLLLVAGHGQPYAGGRRGTWCPARPE